MEFKTITIEQRPMYVIDNAVTEEEVHDFYNLVTNLSFTRTERDNRGDAHCIFNAEFIPEKVETSLRVGVVARQLLQKFFPDSEYLLQRSYINMSHYGDMAYPHRDCALSAKDVTVLYYANKDWDYRWGGETIFYENHESENIVMPKPGRFLIFPGFIEHKGAVPTRECVSSRFTFAFKYKERQ
ncbi:MULTISPECIES: 2OG-Fe(II) oxygenase family protein [Mucilaginibacter]|jgi:hypothetical protein|uniref:2OG-Fe(II) oxygenase family protein n=1 Tax=Mucilaginibacter TaxID=423349 RepID=UPI0016684AA6|nr:2OG-Fe(II) oxygenase [Mucilaginibacter rubeus]GGB29405.1 hypothetical protein GCM10011500_52230 [Mucilaginibacter rubeus]